VKLGLSHEVKKRRLGASEIRFLGIFELREEDLTQV
jgi:hypothetical protein